MAIGPLQGFVALVCLGSLVACAVVQSQPAPVVGSDGKPVSVAVPDGIPYFLPVRPFVITVTEPTGASAPPTITVTEGTAEPDLTNRYILSQGTNLLADNEFNISVGTNGLLESSTSTATSEVTTTVQNAATTIGTVVPGIGLANATLLEAHVKTPLMQGPVVPAAPPALRNIACPVAGASYQLVLYPGKSKPLTLCSSDNNEGGPYEVTWQRTDGATGPFGGKSGDNESANSPTPVSGLFFRHELPYLVRIRSLGTPATESDTIITSPDESETDFFPVKLSFFANNTANITVTDGVITGVDQTTKSELAAAVGLPATFISTYMTAVGNLFSGFTTMSSDQQKALQQALSTRATQIQASVVSAVQNQLCAKTVAGYNFSTMSQSDIATALTAIKAACPGS